MGYKVFVSYKYADSSVKSIGPKNTVRDYVDYLQNQRFSNDDLNKGENDGENLSQFTDDTIRSSLKDKIYDSSVTIVLISPNMKDKWKPEKDQWIPWEIAYSLRNQTRDGRIGHANGILAIVLPDLSNSYGYFFNSYNCFFETKQYSDILGSLRVHDSYPNPNIFTILQKNMFNTRYPVTTMNNGRRVYQGDHSYIKCVRWNDFLNRTDYSLDEAIRLREKINTFNICKTI